MNILIIYAHHEPKSFNEALKDHAVNILKTRGHSVQISDLYKIGFNPVASKNDFISHENPDCIQYMLEQRHASQLGLFTEDIVAEQTKVRAADFILIQTPVWWFSVPAILKGWFDRVLAAGFAWDFGAIYDKGLLRGKKAMLSVTTGGPAAFYSADGPHGADIEQVLFPITHGTLNFCGMEVLPTFVSWSVFQAGDEGRRKYLEAYEKRLTALESQKAMFGF